jgi:drug/metabolite transporter (DMT)-like permease
MRSWGSLARFGTLALMWGSSFLWIKIGLGALSPVQITLVRLVLGAALMLALVFATRAALPKGWRAWVKIIVPASFGSSVPFTLFAVGERTVDSGVAGVLNATTPLWALLLALVLGTERHLGAVRTVGLVLGFAGTLLIFAPWQANGLVSWGALACLLAAISYAVSYTYIARYLSGSLSAAALSAAQLSGGVVLMLILSPFAGGLDPVRLSAGPLVAVAVLGVASTGIAFLLNNRLIADEGAVTATSVGYLLPIVSVLLGAAFLGEGLNLRIIAGMLVVLGGVALSRRHAASGRTAAAEQRSVTRPAG